MRNSPAGDAPDVSFFLPRMSGGGAERVVLHVVDAFCEDGYEVDLVLSNADGALLDQVDGRANIVDLETPSVPAAELPLAIPRLINYLREREPETLFTAMNHVNVFVIVAWWAARVPTKLVVSERNSPEGLLSEGLTVAKLKNSLSYKLSAYLYPKADAVVANSEGVARGLISVVGLQRDQVQVIHNPTVTDSLFEAAKEPLSDPWFADDVPVVLGVGRLEPQKAFDTLIRSVHYVQQNQDIRLVLLGEGSKRTELEALTEELGMADSVRFEGYVENPYKYMSRASVFALSSRWEGLPNVLIEAMACGCPVVSTDCLSGPDEILEGGEYGPLVPVGDSRALAGAIEETLTKPPDSEKLRGRATDFSVDETVSEFEKALL